MLEFFFFLCLMLGSHRVVSLLSHDARGFVDVEVKVHQREEASLCFSSMFWGHEK